MAAVLLNKVYSRPSLMIFSTVEPIEGTGENIGKWDFGSGTVLYLTDDNRDPLQITPTRIESKRRMIDGTMRSVHIADKMSFSTGWTNLPSRKSRLNPPSDGLDNSITSDAFGAGQDIKDWYDSNFSDFWMLLVYDANAEDAPEIGVEKYNVFFDDFQYDIVKRGQFNDLWDVSISLVEK